MSRVVLRCPNCGTTQAGTGECEACHEAQVSYYCTNHSPGHWLEAPTCPQCGARFGEPSPVIKTPPPLATRPTPVTPARQPAREPGPSSPWTRSAPRRGSSEPVSSATVPSLPPPVREDPRAAEREAMTRRLRDIVMRGPAASRYPEVRRAELPDPRPPRNGMVGFIRRLMLLAFFFMAAMFLLSLFSGGPMLQILFNLLLNS
jgi:hypothetical protein